MDGRANRPLAARWIPAILLTALAARLVVMSQSIAPGRDGYRYFAAASTFEGASLFEAVRSMDVHPLYPLALSGTRRWTGDDPARWWRGAQLLGILASLGSLLLAYFAGARLFGSTIAGLGVLWTAMLPRSAGYSVDVLADGLLALTWSASALLCFHAWSERGRSAAWFAAGLLAGAAYLAHVQAILLVAAAIVSVILGQCRARWRLPWGRAMGAIGCLAAGWLLVSGPYMAAIGGLTPRKAAAAVLGFDVGAGRTVSKTSPPAAPKTPTSARRAPAFSSAAAAPSMAPKPLADRPFVADEGVRPVSIVRATGWLLLELLEETRGGILLVLAAPLLLTRSSIRMPQGLLLATFSLIAVAAVVLLKVRAGYLAGRYLGPVLPFWMTLAAAAAVSGYERWRRAWRHRWSPSSWPRARKLALAAAGVAVFWSCAPGWFRAQHRKLGVHREAAAWLAERSEPGEAIFDPIGCASFFAGRPRWAPPEGFRGPPPVPYALVDSRYVYRTEPQVHAAIAAAERAGRPAAVFEENAQVRVVVFDLRARLAGEAGPVR